MYWAQQLVAAAVDAYGKMLQGVVFPVGLGPRGRNPHFERPRVARVDAPGRLFRAGGSQRGAEQQGGGNIFFHNSSALIHRYVIFQGLGRAEAVVLRHREYEIVVAGEACQQSGKHLVDLEPDGRFVLDGIIDGESEGRNRFPDIFGRMHLSVRILEALDIAEIEPGRDAHLAELLGVEVVAVDGHVERFDTCLRRDVDLRVAICGRRLRFVDIEIYADNRRAFVVRIDRECQRCPAESPLASVISKANACVPRMR